MNLDNKKAKSWSDEVDEGFLHAVIEGDLARCKYFAEKGADVRQTDAEGRKNPLRLAAIRSHFHIVKYLVEEKGVNPKDDGKVLHMAVMAGDHLKEIFLYLVEHGADINGIDPTLGTPLMLSIRENGDFTLTKWLISVKADVTVVTPTGTVLHNAVEYGNSELIDYLMNQGADKIVNAANSRDLTPLMLGASKALDDNIKFLVNKWKVDVNYSTDVTALLMATQNDHVNTVRLLCELGANTNAKHSQMQCYPMHLAASNNFIEIVKILLQYGADVDCEDPRGYTPLFMAGTEGYYNCCKILLEAGADADHRAHDDNTTAIYHCVNQNRHKIVKILLEHGANPYTTRNEKNETLLEIARATKKDKLVSLLENWEKLSPEERPKICNVCYKYEENLMKRCSKCKSVYYCSANCQREDWNEHKKLCIKKD